VTGTAPAALQRLSLNQWTVRQWDLRAAVDGCARHGVAAIGLWREHVAGAGLARTASLVRDAGLRVSSLCRGGFFSRPGWRDDNKAAIDEAAALGASCLVLVVGGLPDGSRDLAAARARVADAIAAIVPHARAAGVRLALEPMHPMYCADRGVLSTLAQALAVGRAMMGEGPVDFPPLCQAVTMAGYAGDVEVEIFNAGLWSADPDDVLAQVKQRYAALIAPFR
jgi:sugar phosphate isomerase/epimerase